MRNYLTYLLFLLLFSIFFSCEKLQTKKALVIGEWSVYKAQYDTFYYHKTQVINPYNLTLTYKNISFCNSYIYENNNIKGSVLKLVNNNYNFENKIENFENYNKHIFEFNKDKTFKSVKTFDSGKQEIKEGKWFFLKKNKKENIKRNENISLTITKSYYYNIDGSISIYPLDLTPDYICILDKKKKEITISNSLSLFNNQNFSGLTTHIKLKPL